MSKQLPRIMEIIQAELINSGLNEFENDDGFTFFDDEFAFIQKVMRFDDDVEQIVSRIFFKGISLESDEADKKFKKMFVNKFLNRKIGYQTVEAFASQLIYTVLLNEDFLNEYYSSLDKYLSNQNEAVSTDDKSNVNDQRSLQSDLPQNNINLNVDDTVLNYGNSNTINRTKSQDEGTSENKSQQYSLDSLEKLNGLLERVFKDIDKRCFLHVY